MSKKVKQDPKEDQTPEENTEDLSFLNEGDEDEKETW